MPQLKIKDIAIIASIKNGKNPIGEAPQGGERHARMSSDERGEMLNRLLSDITTLMKEAEIVHLENNYTNNNELDPDFITRLSTNEFFFYTQEALTLQEFETLQNKIAEQAKLFPSGIQLALGSFAVKNDKNQVMNVVSHLTCGKNPSFNFLVKNYTSTLDVRYKEESTKGNFITLPKFDVNTKPPVSMPELNIDGTPVGFTFNNIISCKTPRGDSFFTALDICLDHHQGVARLNIDKLVKENPTVNQQLMSHMVLSNSVALNARNSFGSVMHVDPAYSLQHCKISIPQTIASTDKLLSFGKNGITLCELPPTSIETLQETIDFNKKIQPDAEEFAALINKLEQLKFGPKDTLMDKFIFRQENKFIKCITPSQESERKNFIKELQQLVVTLEKETAIKDIKTAITKFRENSGLFTIGMNNKADRIEKAMLKVPVEDRLNFLSSESSKEVMKALASHRYLGKNNEELNVQTAAVAFKKFREKFKETFEETDKTEEKENISILSPKK